MGKLTQEKEQRDTFLESIPEKLREPTKQLLRRLFPRFQRGGHSPDFLPKWRKNKRICSEEIFPIYFRLTVPEDKISQEELQLLLDNTANKDHFARILIEYSEKHKSDGQTKFPGLIQRFGDFLEEVPSEHIKPVVEAFLQYGDQMIKEEDQGTGLYGMQRSDLMIWMIVRDLLKRLPTKDRENILYDALEKSDSIYIVIYTIQNLLLQHDEERDYQPPKDERLIDSTKLNDFKKLGLQIIEKTAKDDNLIESSNLSTILYRWKDWGDLENVKNWVQELIEDDVGLLKFLFSFKNEQRVQNLGLATGTGDVVAQST